MASGAFSISVAEAGLAALEGALGLVALGDVVDDRGDADDVARVVHELRIVPVAEDDPSVLRGRSG